jgi:hypothetical protein
MCNSAQIALAAQASMKWLAQDSAANSIQAMTGQTAVLDWVACESGIAGGLWSRLPSEVYLQKG